jgi:outer membrane protein OmpA-like peptidoglycan-associated protein
VAELVLNGYVTDSASLLPANAWLIIQKGQFIDSVQTAYNDGGYQLQLQGEGTYAISLHSNEYETIADTLIATVSTGTYYKEFRKDYKLKKKIKPYLISGYVYDEQTKVPLAVTLAIELPDSATMTTNSDESGYYEIKAKIAGEWILRVQKINYLNLEDKLAIGDDQLFLNYTKDLYMSPIAVGKTVIINNIYFNFDKSSLKEASFPELGRLTDLLNQNPGITIEISGHTDDKGSDDYNLALSEGRAESVMGYLLDQGIVGERMKAKGYGEAKPISSNVSEIGSAENRRVEFTILSVD